MSHTYTVNNDPNSQEAIRRKRQIDNSQLKKENGLRSAKKGL